MYLEAVRLRSDKLNELKRLVARAKRRGWMSNNRDAVSLVASGEAKGWIKRPACPHQWPQDAPDYDEWVRTVGRREKAAQGHS